MIDWCKIFGHKFRPRYTTTNKAFEKLLDSAESISLNPRAILALQEHEYKGDVCERCGTEIWKYMK